MFLGVSVRLRGVDMTDEQRTRLAARIRAERMRQYASKSAAYRQAGLNAATWDRLEQGERVREDRLIAALKLLWPHSGGDWRQIDTAPDEPARTVEDRLAEIERRLAAVEQTLYEGTGEPNDTPPMSQAGGRPAIGSGDTGSGPGGRGGGAAQAGPASLEGSEPMRGGIQRGSLPRRRPTRGRPRPQDTPDGTTDISD